MAKLNPIDEANYIEKEYRNYLKSTFKFNDVTYENEYEKELDNTVLYKGPYININLPFKTGHSLNELIEQGKVSSEFKKLSGIKLDQKLYKHQEEALEKIQNGKNVVITTGTGSGKTESFLYPILNEILREIENGNNEPGIRAIFLYPMNALVNDQIARVRKILKDYPKIRYGFFTGDTKEKKSEALRKKLEIENGESLPENELVTRDEIREKLPHLLFTNYSMLEYLLIRPTDYRLFEKENLNNWKFVILDEAHTYNGALGIEVSLLLRRLTGMANKKPQFILTSATLGTKGKNEDDIVKFANSLTTTQYSNDDIIFSTRKTLDYNNIKYSIEPKKYMEIEKNINDTSKLNSISNEYIKESNIANEKEIIYELLIKDKNIYEIFEYLKKESRLFNDLFEHMKKFGFNDKRELTALIHLINIARKNGTGIYETKYHTFIRALSGAYVTIAKNKKTLKLKNYNSIDNLKAFELGNCRFCNSSYIMGKTIASKVDGLDYLLQNEDVDIYENYDEALNISMEYYLMKDSVDEDEIDLSNCKDYTLCSKCGHIFQSKNINAQKCACGEEYEVQVYKVENEDKKNNISQCPCCHHKSVRGIVRALDLGKDEATIIIAQILYQAIDNNEKKESNCYKIPKDFSFFNDEKKCLIKKEETAKDDVKQFIAFSDSRQQASFFASFLDYTYKRFLRKRLIWNEIEKNNFEPMDLNTLVSRLTSTITNEKLFRDDNIEPQKQAWITILSELLNLDGNYGAEGLGLFYFKIETENIMNCFEDKQLEPWNEKYNLNKEELSNLICILFECAKKVPAINYEKSELTIKEKEDELQYRKFNNYIKLKRIIDSKEKNIYSFIPVTNKTDNNQLNYIMKLLKVDREEGIKLLEIIFKSFGRKTGLLENSKDLTDQEAFQINANKYRICSYKKSKFYKCNKCGKITPYNVKNVCPTRNCDGKLIEFEPDKDRILKDNYYRQQYINKKIEPLIIKEHTAQITRSIAKRYQNEFKNKEINILSCSTTFEMGIDIGDLETVFMRNVPPTPANYVQRAGRAGRRDDSSAFVLTFCGANSHDFTYFNNPNEMISGVINPPKFTITNEKIILRHLTAAALGFYFKKYPETYKNIETLICDGGLNRFSEYIKSNPKDLNDYINNKILTPEIYNKYADYKWFYIIKNNVNNAIDTFESEIKENLKGYKKEQELAANENRYKDAEYYKNQIEKIKKENIIKELSNYNIIPKYGFPVDSVELKIYKDGKIIDVDNLTRDLSIAISEYAPESEIIANKEKYTSRYITIPRNKGLTRYYFNKCNNCDRYNVSEFPDTLNKCKYCGDLNQTQVVSYFIEPSYGFKTGENKSSRNKKPKKTYSSEKLYLGSSKEDNKIEISNIISIETTSDDELLVLNNKDFYMCKQCGYSEIAVNGAKIEYKEHKNYLGRDCSNKELIKLNIGHKFKTDVAKISVKGLEDYSDALSFLYAILEGISITFNIERRDIDGLVIKNKELNYDVIIFDNVPGGAGHTKRLANKDEFLKSINEAYKKVNQDCCDENTSCYNCLRNYNNQKLHKYLKRKNAKRVIKTILESIK